MWAGGGSGSSSLCSPDPYSVYGGGGGAYASFNVKTYMKNIIMNVGSGGIGNFTFNYTPPCYYYCNCSSGQNSWFSSYDFNLTVQGGTTGCFNASDRGRGGYVFINNTQNIIAINGTNGTRSAQASMSIYCSGAGGSSGLYNNGGRTICSSDSFRPSDDGKIAGGGGSTGTSPSNGGDGLIKIYLSI